MSDRSFAAPSRRPLAAAAALVALALLAVLSIADVQPPAPRSASAPAGDFSAARAFTHVERIGQEVHVTGSPAADRVREHIVATLTGYGLRPEVQDTVGVNAGKFGDGGMARVRNVVAVLPGAASTGQVVLMAHYDSVQVSYGANDDGAGTSTLLEVARALTTGAPPRNDVVFLFTDAEEACLCGAEAFVSRHPLGQKPSVVLNFEARGSSGPAVMFQTSVGNADLIDVYARTPHPVGTSLAVEVYRLLSNDTDFTPFLGQSRFTGLNTAYIDGSSVYHSPFDRPSTMDKASLQHHGDNALALARTLGGADLPPLLFDDDQAVAVAVALQTATMSVEGVEEAALRALATVRQVMPARLRQRVDALQVTRVAKAGWQPSRVDTAVLLAIGQAVRAREVLRFDYAGVRELAAGQAGDRRRVEPHHVVTWGGRWYLIGYDLDRADWRTYRVDRMTLRTPNGPRFAPRPLPAADVAAFVAERFEGHDPLPCRGEAILHAPAAAITEWTRGQAIVEDVAPDRCRVSAGSWSWTGLAAWFGMFDVEVELIGPPQLREATAALAARFARAAAG